MKYVAWIVLVGLLAWVVFVIARLGSPWVSAGVVGLVGLILLVNQLSRRPEQKAGQPPPEFRVISTDRDRWGA